MNRPYRDRSGDEIRALADRHWDDFDALAKVAYEMQFRNLIRKQRKAAVIERLVELASAMARPPENEPDFEFPSTDIYETRRRTIRELDHVDWRETGLLGASGYRVGKVRGRARETRRRILNFVFLRDDLRGVEDASYAAEWGDPMTSKRLQKLSETIASFTRTAKRRPQDMEQAISEWEADLAYLKTTFYDRWGDFPWPDVEI